MQTLLLRSDTSTKSQMIAVGQPVQSPHAQSNFKDGGADPGSTMKSTPAATVPFVAADTSGSLSDVPMRTGTGSGDRICDPQLGHCTPRPITYLVNTLHGHTTSCSIPTNASYETFVQTLLDASALRDTGRRSSLGRTDRPTAVQPERRVRRRVSEESSSSHDLASSGVSPAASSDALAQKTISAAFVTHEGRVLGREGYASLTAAASAHSPPSRNSPDPLPHASSWSDPPSSKRPHRFRGIPTTVAIAKSAPASPQHPSSSASPPEVHVTIRLRLRGGMTDRQNRVGSKFGGGGVSSAQSAERDRKERLRELALESVDLARDPYLMRNHLGTYECKLCLTLHTNEGNYLAHTQGRKHQAGLARRAAMEAKLKPAETLPAPHTLAGVGASAATKRANRVRIGRPGYEVSKSRDPVTNQRCLSFELHYPELDEDSVQPRHRFMSAYEQRVDSPPDRRYQYLLVACDPYETVAFKVPNEPIDRGEGRFVTNWDREGKKFTLTFYFLEPKEGAAEGEEKEMQ